MSITDARDNFLFDLDGRRQGTGEYEFCPAGTSIGGVRAGTNLNTPDGTLSVGVDAPRKAAVPAGGELILAPRLPYLRLAEQAHAGDGALAADSAGSTALGALADAMADVMADATTDATTDAHDRRHDRRHGRGDAAARRARHRSLSKGGAAGRGVARRIGARHPL